MQDKQLQACIKGGSCNPPAGNHAPSSPFCAPTNWYPHLHSGSKSAGLGTSSAEGMPARGGVPPGLLPSMLVHRLLPAAVPPAVGSPLRSCCCSMPAGRPPGDCCMLLPARAADTVAAAAACTGEKPAWLRACCCWDQGCVDSRQAPQLVPAAAAPAALALDCWLSCPACGCCSAACAAARAAWYVLTLLGWKEPGENGSC